jgi:hypothetical protein
MPRVEVLRSTTTAAPLIMVDRGEVNPPVYTVDEAHRLMAEEVVLNNDTCDGGSCLACVLYETLALLA